MRGQMMGKVSVAARVENLADLFEVQQGTRPADQVRAVDIPDALVDTGATTLGLPRSLLGQLGLTPAFTRQVRMASGLASVQIYRATRLTVQGRDCICDVMELADGVPALIG